MRLGECICVLALGAGALLVGLSRVVSAEFEESGLTLRVQAEVLDELGQLLKELYVIPEMADALITMLEANQSSGRYGAISDPDDFARTLTGDLQEMSGDKHLRVMFGESIEPQQVRVVRRRPGDEEGTPGGPSDTPSRRMPGSGSSGGVFEQSAGITESKMLPGNIGYVDIHMFIPRSVGESEAKTVAAMKTVESADALIFDLRMCAGGSPDMIHFITSYLYPPEPMHLLTYYHGHEEPERAYTLSEIPGRRMPEVPVYILTSSFTASGGEEFAYSLKHHGRATVVGETTAGAGHGGGVHPVHAGFHAFIPDFRPVHPVTGGGWEGVGVVPDIRVDVAAALSEAQIRALETLLSTETSPSRRTGLQSVLDDTRTAKAELSARETIGARKAGEYVGRFEYRTISAEDGVLYLQREGGPKLKMIPAGDPDEFTLERVPQAKIKFGRNEAGAVDALHVLAMSGDWEVTRRE